MANVQKNVTNFLCTNGAVQIRRGNFMQNNINVNQKIEHKHTTNETTAYQLLPK